MSQTAHRIVQHPAFHRAVIAAIVLNGALMGVETSESLLASHGGLLRGLNAAFQALFVAEIAVRIAACAPRPLRFFADPWNVFDFSVVALSLLPAVGPLATIARLARILRVVRLISVVPELRLVIDTMLRSIPSLGHVVLLQTLLIYVYGVLGWHLYHETDPAHWGTLLKSCETLFQLLTLENWVQVMQDARGASRFTWLFFASYIVVAVFVVINLFIAVVINNLEKSKRSQAAASEDEAERRIAAIEAELQGLREALRR